MKKIQPIIAFFIYFCWFGVMILVAVWIILTPVINEKNQVFSNFSWSLEEPLDDKNKIDPYMKTKWLTLQWKTWVKDEELPDTYDESNREKVYMYPFDRWRFKESIKPEEISDYNNYFVSYEQRKALCSIKDVISKNFVTSFIVNQPDQKQPIETVRELKKLFEVMFPKKLSYEVALGVVLDQNNRVIEIIHFKNGDHESVASCPDAFKDVWAINQSKYANQSLKIIAIHNHPDPKPVIGEPKLIGASLYSPDDYDFAKTRIKRYNLPEKKSLNPFILVNNLVYGESDKGLAGPKNDLTQPLTEEIVNKWYVTTKSNEIYKNLNKSFELIKIPKLKQLSESIIN